MHWCYLAASVVAAARAALAGEMAITGELSFDLHVLNVNRKSLQESGSHEPALHESENVTAAPYLECVYQYPESAQINAMLSNMMNELTKLFVHVHQYLRSPADGRREDKAELSRFKVVRTRVPSDFDHAYANMTEEYRRFFNKTTERVPRSGNDPCQHQDEIRELWRELLDSSQEGLRRAAVQSIDHVLQQRGARSHTRRRVAQLLTRELHQIRASQLSLLCDTFQLCFNDLLS